MISLSQSLLTKSCKRVAFMQGSVYERNADLSRDAGACPAAKASIIMLHLYVAGVRLLTSICHQEATMPSAQATVYDLIIFGATSFVGQLTARYLEKSLQGQHDSLRWDIAGRSQ